MTRTRSFALYWLPVVVWMVVIFSASSDSGSIKHTSRFLGPFFRWLFPKVSDHAIGEMVFAVRKCAHLTEYAILAALVWRARRKPRRNDPRPWLWREAGFALVFTALYAATDEIHQTFVPSRQASVWDVLLDSLGAVCGLLLLKFVLNLFRKRQTN